MITSSNSLKIIKQDYPLQQSSSNHLLNQELLVVYLSIYEKLKDFDIIDTFNQEDIDHNAVKQLLKVLASLLNSRDENNFTELDQKFKDIADIVCLFVNLVHENFAVLNFSITEKEAIAEVIQNLGMVHQKLGMKHEAYSYYLESARLLESSASYSKAVALYQKAEENVSEINNFHFKDHLKQLCKLYSLLLQAKHTPLRFKAIKNEFISLFQDIVIDLFRYINMYKDVNDLAVFLKHSKYFFEKFNDPILEFSKLYEWLDAYVQSGHQSENKTQLFLLLKKHYNEILIPALTKQKSTFREDQLLEIILNQIDASSSILDIIKDWNIILKNNIFPEHLKTSMASLVNNCNFIEFLITVKLDYSCDRIDNMILNLAAIFNKGNYINKQIQKIALHEQSLSQSYQIVNSYQKNAFLQIMKKNIPQSLQLISESMRIIMKSTIGKFSLEYFKRLFLFQLYLTLRNNSCTISIDLVQNFRIITELNTYLSPKDLEFLEEKSMQLALHFENENNANQASICYYLAFRFNPNNQTAFDKYIYLMEIKQK